MSEFFLLGSSSRTSHCSTHHPRLGPSKEVSGLPELWKTCTYHGLVNPPTETWLRINAEDTREKSQYLDQNFSVRLYYFCRKLGGGGVFLGVFHLLHVPGFTREKDSSYSPIFFFQWPTKLWKMEEVSRRKLIWYRITSVVGGGIRYIHTSGQRRNNTSVCSPDLYSHVKDGWFCDERDLECVFSWSCVSHLLTGI